jgi:hypothetical protein
MLVFYIYIFENTTGSHNAPLLPENEYNKEAFASLWLQNLAAKSKFTQNTFLLYFNNKLRGDIRQQNFLKGRDTH